MFDLSRDGDVYTLTMNAGENRWNTSFVHAFGKVLDEVETSEGPATLITTSPSSRAGCMRVVWRREASADRPVRVHPARSKRRCR